jgi:chaperonin GroES
MNFSGIEPTEFNCLVQPEDVGDKIGNILIADETKERKQATATRGTLIAVSPVAFTYEEWPKGATPPRVGDTVIIAKGSGVLVEGLDGKMYRLVKDKDVCAVIRDRLKALDADIAEANREAVA